MCSSRSGRQVRKAWVTSRQAWGEIFWDRERYTRSALAWSVSTCRSGQRVRRSSSGEVKQTASSRWA